MSNGYSLQNLNMMVKPKEKVAIIGSNQSGKHTLMNLLMGLTDMSKIERGIIEVDQVNIGSVDLRHLRKNVMYLHSKPV